MSRLSSFWSELRRRNVLKAGGAYLAGGWVLIQLADTVLPVLGAPPWTLRVFLFILVVGFPLVLAFSWAFELTPEELKRTAEARSVAAPRSPEASAPDGGSKRRGGSRPSQWERKRETPEWCPPTDRRQDTWSVPRHRETVGRATGRRSRRRSVYRTALAV